MVKIIKGDVRRYVLGLMKILFRAVRQLSSLGEWKVNNVVECTTHVGLTFSVDVGGIVFNEN